MTDNAVAADCTRCDAAAISAYIGAVNEAVFDVDDSGKPTLGEDGVIIMRYMFGYTGAALINNAIDTNYCNRCEAADIEAYIQLLFPN